MKTLNLLFIGNSHTYYFRMSGSNAFTPSYMVADTAENR